MRVKTERAHRGQSWLLPMVLILFILEIVLLPVTLGIAYGGPGDGPSHVLTYESGRLVWDSATGIREDGTAELSFFSDRYRGVEAHNGQKLVAPGTDGKVIIRLKNHSRGLVTYTAVLYRIRSNPSLPVEAGLSGNAFTDTDAYSLPEGVMEENVVRAVNGTLSGNMFQDFSIHWLWTLEGNEAQDEVDTALGDQAAFGETEDITVGFYIVLEDDNTHITPEPPKTGDDAKIGRYVALMCVSGIMLFILLVSRRKREGKET